MGSEVEVADNQPGPRHNIHRMGVGDKAGSLPVYEGKQAGMGS